MAILYIELMLKQAGLNISGVAFLTENIQTLLKLHGI
jgi:hypothetical protein